jgi:hypothetical protein
VSKQSRSQKRLFARWLWLVYLPIALSSALSLIWLIGLLPGQLAIPLFLLIAYDAIAVRLLLERKKLGVSIPAPRQLVFGLASIAALVVVGAISFLVGWKRLATNGQGLRLMGVGAFLLAFSITLPLFKVIDSIFRGTGKILSRRRSRRRKTSAKAET